MPPAVQPYNGQPIERLPVEIVRMIISECMICSVTIQRRVPMDFLLTCRSWRVIGESCRRFFVPHLVVNGHDEVGQLLTLYARNLIHPSITNLTVNLALEYKEEPLGGTSGHIPAMVQIQQDIERLRDMVVRDWVVSNTGRPNHWRSLNLKRFSLVVNLSTASAHKPLLEAWTRAWVARLSRQWRGMGWRGDEGIYDRFRYSYWDQ